MTVVRDQHDGVAQGNAEQGDKAHQRADGQHPAGDEHHDHAAGQRERQVGEHQDGRTHAAQRHIQQQCHPRRGQCRMQQQILLGAGLLRRIAGVYQVSAARQGNLSRNLLFYRRDKTRQCTSLDLGRHHLQALRVVVQD